MLERARIRQQAVALLKAANTAAGAHVYDSRVSPNSKNKLPALNVYTLLQNGSGTAQAGTAPQFDTTVTLSVECVVSQADAWGAALDDLCEQVENALLCNPGFISEFDMVTSYSTAMQAKDEGENPIIKAVMSIGLKYTEQFDPIIPDTLGRVHITVDAIEPADKNIAADGGPDGRAEGVLDLAMDT